MYGGQYGEYAYWCSGVIKGSVVETKKTTWIAWKANGLLQGSVILLLNQKAN